MADRRQQPSTGAGTSRKSNPLTLVERHLSRREAVKFGLVGSGALLASLYVKPAFNSIGAAPAYAAGTQLTPEGCTPGLWKNHTSLWVGYSPSDDFDTIFGVDAFNPNLTLLQALQQGGGGVKALGRHSVAALLNAANPDVDYGLSTSTVISMVQDALAQGGDIEGTKNELALRNEASCDVKEGLSLRADP